MIAYPVRNICLFEQRLNSETLTRQVVAEAMSLLHLLSYVGTVAAVGFVVLSLASGLLWISELIEEHSRIAKVIGVRAVYAIIIVHVLLYFTDSLPFLLTLFSIVCHIVYLQNFSNTWPCISLGSRAFVASCVLAISNHFMWFFYFSRVSSEARARARMRGYRGGGGGSGGGGSEVQGAPGFADVATFFAMCVWLVPLFLFLSLSANDNALPVSSDGSPTTYTTPQLSSGSRAPSLFKSVLDLFPFLRRRRDRTEGVLISHTPTHSAPSTPRTSYSGQHQNQNQNRNPYALPSRTSFDSVSTTITGPSLNLRPPPRRSKTGTEAASSPGIQLDEAARRGGAVSRKSASVLVSRSGSDETPVRRRGHFE